MDGPPIAPGLAPPRGCSQHRRRPSYTTHHHLRGSAGLVSCATGQPRPVVTAPSAAHIPPQLPKLAQLVAWRRKVVRKFGCVKAKVGHGCADSCREVWTVWEHILRHQAGLRAVAGQYHAYQKKWGRGQRHDWVLHHVVGEFGQMDSNHALHHARLAILIQVYVAGGKVSSRVCRICSVPCVPCVSGEDGVEIRRQSAARKARPALMARRSWLRRCLSIVATRAAQANLPLGALSFWNHSSMQSITSGWRSRCAHQSRTRKY